MANAQLDLTTKVETQKSPQAKTSTKKSKKPVRQAVAPPPQQGAMTRRHWLLAALLVAVAGFFVLLVSGLAVVGYVYSKKSHPTVTKTHDGKVSQPMDFGKFELAGTQVEFRIRDSALNETFFNATLSHGQEFNEEELVVYLVYPGGGKEFLTRYPHTEDKTKSDVRRQINVSGEYALTIENRRNGITTTEKVVVSPSHRFGK